MSGNPMEKLETERLRIQHAFWLAIFGLLLAAILVVVLVFDREPVIKSSSEVVAIIGLFTSVTGTLVGTFFGLQIGSAGVEHERRSRRNAEEVTRLALAHLHPDTAKELVSTMQQQS